MQSEALKQFRSLVKADNKWSSKPQKIENERRNLLFWFVDNCPSKNGPDNARSFDSYGINHSSHYKKLKNRILEAVNLKNNITYKYCKNGTDMEKLIGEVIDLYKKRHKAIIFFAKGDYEEMDSLYIRIRNSFAHGNYFKVGDYYVLWNESGGNNKKLGSFMMLKYEHLKDIYIALER